MWRKKGPPGILTTAIAIEKGIIARTLYCLYMSLFDKHAKAHFNALLFWQDEMTVFTVNLLFWPFHTRVSCTSAIAWIVPYRFGCIFIIFILSLHTGLNHTILQLPHFHRFLLNWSSRHCEPLLQKISLAWISLLIPDWHSWMVPSNSASPKFRKPAIAYSIVCSFPFFVLSSPEEWIRDPPFC